MHFPLPDTIVDIDVVYAYIYSTHGSFVHSESALSLARRITYARHSYCNTLYIDQGASFPF